LAPPGEYVYAGAVAKYCDECVCLMMYVGASVYLSDRIGYPLRNHTRDLYHSLPFFIKLFVHVAYVGGSVLPWHVDDRPHRLSAGRG